MHAGCFLIALLLGNKNLIPIEELGAAGIYNNNNSLLYIRNGHTSIKTACMHFWRAPYICFFCKAFLIPLSFVRMCFSSNGSLQQI